MINKCNFNNKWLVGIAEHVDALAMTLGIFAILSSPLSLEFHNKFQKHTKSVASVNTAQLKKSGITLTALPIEVKKEDTHMDLAKKLSDKDIFMALALSVENVPSTAYVDASGANAGAGYCIEARRKSLGLDVVKIDLAMAGFSEKEISDLVSKDTQRIEAVQVTKEQALRLLSMTKPKYELMAKEALGDEYFNALPSHKKDVLSYLAYNTGGPEKFVKLMKAVKNNNEIEALSQLTPSIRTKGGLVKNNRLRAWAQAAWIGSEELKQALNEPVEFEKKYAGKSGQEKFIHAHMAFISKKLTIKREGLTQQKEDKGGDYKKKGFHKK